MPSAIDEALNNLVDSDGKNHIVFRNKSQGKIVMNFRKQYPSIRDSVTLQRLDEDIKAEKAQLQKTNKTQLQLLEQKINQLNEEMKLLTNSKRLTKLKERFVEQRENGVELIPALSVYIKK